MQKPDYAVHRAWEMWNICINWVHLLYVSKMKWFVCFAWRLLFTARLYTKPKAWWENMVLKAVQHTQIVDKKRSFYILLGLGRKKETPGEDCAFFFSPHFHRCEWHQSCVTCWLSHENQQASASDPWTCFIGFHWWTWLSQRNVCCVRQ